MTLGIVLLWTFCAGFVLGMFVNAPRTNGPEEDG